MMLSTLLDVFYSRVYALLIGKIYGARDLGFYVRADTASQILPAMIGVIAARVAFPVLSRIQEDRENFRETLRSYLEFTVFINTPIMFGLISTSHAIFGLTFGSDWLPSVDYFNVLCLIGIFRPFYVLNQQALMAIGRSDLIFRLEITKKILGIFIICASVMFGILAMAWSSVFSAVIFLLINTYYSENLISYGIVRQIIGVHLIIISSLAMFIFLIFMDFMMSDSGIIKLILMVTSGSLFYFILSFILRVRPAVISYNFIVKSVRKVL